MMRLNTLEDSALAVLQYSIDAVFLSTSDGRIFSANPAACELLGRTEEEICALGRGGLVVPTPELTEALERRAKVGHARAQLSMIHHDGSHVEVELTSSIFRTPSGEERTVIIARDMRELRQAEREAQESRSALDAIVNNTTDLIFSVDATTYGLLWFNDRLRDYFRVHQGLELAVGMRPSDLLSDPALVQQWKQFYEQTLRDGTLTTEYTAALADRIMELSLRCIPNKDAPTAIAVFGRDVTEERATVRALMESEQKYRSVVHAMAEGVVFQAADGRIIETNLAAQEIEGRSDDDMAGHTSDDDMWGAVREDGTPFPGDEHPSMVTLRTGEPQVNVVMGIRRPSGERRWISINSEPVYGDGDGTLTAAVTTFHDITELKNADDALSDHVRQLETLMQQTLHAVARMVELRDPYTSGHMARVGIIARDIAAEMGWDHSRCRVVELAGTVHDVGKIAVPAEVLTKPSRLSALEMELVRSHAEWTYEILKDIEFPEPIATIVHQHHERLDGSGYPLGLRGDEILPEARILAVADVLESMASHRPYRPALGTDVALTEIVSHRGTMFDPEVVDALFRLFTERDYRFPDAV